MATLDWTCETIDGVALVELVVTSDRTQRVRIESNLTPVWPPRQQGHPAAGWDGSTFEDQIEAESPLVVGYASPAEAVEPPAELTTEPPTEDDDIAPRDVIRALGDGTPPRDAVPTDRPAPDEPTATPTDPPPAEHRPEIQTEPPTAASGTSAESAAALPPTMETYFDALDRRIAAAERLAEPETVDQAREAVTAAGGIRAVSELKEQLRADRTRLKRLGDRQQALANRLDAVEIPVERLDCVT